MGGCTLVHHLLWPPDASGSIPYLEYPLATLAQLGAIFLQTFLNRAVVAICLRQNAVRLACILLLLRGAIWPWANDDDAAIINRWRRVRVVASKSFGHFARTNLPPRRQKCAYGGSAVQQQLTEEQFFGQLAGLERFQVIP
jgi:hypothetical protein